jgi:hypothetical protein
VCGSGRFSHAAGTETLVNIPLPRAQDAIVTLEGTGDSMDIDTYLACLYLEMHGWRYFIDYYPNNAQQIADERMKELKRMSQ